MEPEISYNVKEQAEQILKLTEKVQRLEEGGSRFIDLSRVPLICQSIVDIREDLKEIRQNFKDLGELKIAMTKLSADFDPVRKIAYGIMTVVGLGVLGAILTLVLR
jgi:hypothetical protein